MIIVYLHSEHLNKYNEFEYVNCINNLYRYAFNSVDIHTSKKVWVIGKSQIVRQKVNIISIYK